MSGARAGRGAALRSRGWTPDMDAVLHEARAKNLSHSAIAELLFRHGFGSRSGDAVRERMRRLGILATDGLDEGVPCVRDAFGADPLLLALAAVHKAAPKDAVPPPADGRRLHWQSLAPSAGSAGSPAALCAAEGDTHYWR